MKYFVTTIIVLMAFIGELYSQKMPQNTITNFPTLSTPTEAIQEDLDQYFQKTFMQGVNSIASGDWNEPGVWDCGCVPTFQDDVTINTGHVITINQDVNFTSIFIDSAAIVLSTIAGETYINITGDWTNNGAFSATNCYINFNGFDNQEINGNTEFNFLTVEHEKELSINSALAITNRLNLSDATIITNNNLSLKYFEGRTAEISSINTGSIVGEITAESLVSLTTAGWFSTAAPISDATLTEWNDDVVTTGFTGADYPAFSFNNILYFTEHSGYIAVTDINNPITPGAGYFIYESAGENLIDISGTPVIGDFAFPISYTDTISSENKGWNLLGNPYVASINWENQEGWSKNNIGSAIYIWDENSLSYKTYLNGNSVNGGTPIIKPFDNFFVQADNNPILEINESAKQTGDYEPITPQDNFFKFKLENENGSDEIVIILDENAANDYSIDEDAIRNFNNVTNEFVTVSEDSVQLSINALEYNPEGFDIPIIINSPNGGTFTLQVESLPQGLNTCYSLENTVTGEAYNLLETIEIFFTIDATESDELFILHIGGSVEATKTDVLCHANADGTINATGSGAGPWDYYWYDQNSNLIFEDTSSTSTSYLENLDAGEYTVTIGNLDFCAALTQTIIISEPNEITFTSTVIQPQCNELNGGAISIDNVIGGTGSFSLLWNNGSTSNSIEELEGGEYVVTITDTLGCVQTETYDIIAATLVNANFTLENVTPLEDGLNEATFNNTSTNATSYVWDFGDGEQSIEENPIHIYALPGEYLISLIAYHDDCSETFSFVTTIEESTVNINELTSSNSAYIINQNDINYLKFEYNQPQRVTVTVYNVVGQEISTSSYNTVVNDKIKLNVAQNSNQIYFVKLQNNNTDTQEVFKIIQR